jgi:hypothetical protein
MNDKEKSQLIAEAENVEAIRDFFSEWYSVEELYETIAKCSITLLHIIDKGALCSDEVKEMRDLLTQHQMMVEHMKPFARKEGEV